LIVPRQIFARENDFMASTQTKHIVPRIRYLRVFERLISPLLILACILVIGTLPFSLPNVLAVTIIWVLLAMAYLAFRYLAGRSHPMFAKDKALFRALVGVFSIFILQMSILFAGYDSDQANLHSIWLLYLVPLITIARFGTTLEWIFLATLVSAALVVPQLVISLTALGRANASGIQMVTSVLLYHPVLSTIAQSATLALFGGAILTLIRQGQVFDAVRQIVGDMTETLATQASYLEAFQEAAKAIASLKRFQYIFILHWDEKLQHLKLVGAIGKPPEVWKNIELKREQGITGQVLVSGKPILAKDVSIEPWSSKYHLAKGFEDVRCELAVPVIYQGKVVGVLDVEGAKPGMYDDRDITILEGFAKSLAISFGHFLSIDHRVASAYRLAIETMEAGVTNTRLSSWLAQVGEFAREFLGISGLVFLRLAPGTSYPIFPAILWPRNLNMIGRTQNIPSLIPEASLIWYLLRDWELRYWTEQDGWGDWNNSVDNWLIDALKLASAKMLVFVPVGPPERPVACLFVIFPYAEQIGDVQRLALTMFGAALESSFHSIARPRVGPRRTGSAVHHGLIPSTQKLFAELAIARNSLNDSASLLSHLDNIEQGIVELRSTIKHLTMNDRYDLSSMSLQKTLEDTANEFEELKPGVLTIRVQVDHLIEDEPLYVRQVLYWVVSEAIANAVVHGKADLIDAKLNRGLKSITSEITDNGQGMPEHVFPPSDSYGIFYLKRALKWQMRANLKHKRINPKGTCVCFTIPTRPRKVETND
jgi:putative methionine-R-sulfoxide reductase with GAF domain/two-component sensor histidine kinase